MKRMSIPAINQIELQQRRVLLRLDLNVPLDEEGNITDDTRIRAALPTINYALARSCRLIICSHLGRPKGKLNPSYSLEPVGARLAELLDHDVLLSDYPVGDGASQLVQKLRAGDILLLENVRFDQGETGNDPAFAKQLAQYTEIFINDAFGTAHRAHASTVGILDHLDGVSGVGFLIEKELEALGKLKEDPARPFVAILGGSKVSDKIGLIKELLNQCQAIIVGGAMAYTFLKAQDKNVGASRVELDQLSLAERILNIAASKDVKFYLPTDHVVAREVSPNAPSEIIEDEFEPDHMGLDIGPTTRSRYASVIKEAGKIFWNGPMGVFEIRQFSEGTEAVAKAMSETKAFTVVGGGDSAAAIRQFGYDGDVSHVCTGGGAALSFLEGKTLPGIEALHKAAAKQAAKIQNTPQIETDE
jgi:phosphoglycerate kinase